MTFWLGEVPSVVSFGISLAVAWAVTYAIMMIARGWLRLIGMTAGPALAPAWATASGALCALLFAFTIVTLWNLDSKARQDLDDETATIRFVALDLAPSQLHLLRHYLLLSIDEWPRLCGGIPDDRVDRALVTLQSEGMPRRPSLDADLSRELGALEELRNRRWQSADAAVPSEIWVALTVLSLVIVVVLAIAMTEHRMVHTVLMLALATSLGTLFWVAIVQEYPFCGIGSPHPNELLSILRAQAP